MPPPPLKPHFAMRVYNLLVRCKLFPSHRPLVVRSRLINVSSSSSLTQQDSLTSLRDDNKKRQKAYKTFFGEQCTRFIEFPDKANYLKLVRFRDYITTLGKKHQNFSLLGKVLVAVRCSSCCEEESIGEKCVTARLVHEVAYDHGIIIFRCQSCLRLFLISDHLQLFKNTSDVNVNLSSFVAPLFSDSNVKLLRFDKDTIEIVPTEVAKQHETSHKVVEDVYREAESLYPDNDEFGFTKLVHDDVDGCLEENFTSNTELIDVRDSNMIECVDRTKVLHLRYEYEMLRYSVIRVPDRVSEYHWIFLLQKLSSKGHLAYLRYVFKTQKLVESAKFKKTENRENSQAKRRARFDEGALAGPSSYGIGMNTLFRRLSRRNGARLMRSNVANGYLFGHQIVYDFGYERDMDHREVVRAAQQIVQAYGFNSRQKDAGRLIFTNLAAGGKMHRELDASKIFDSHSFIDTTSAHPIEVFDKDNLVFLTPDAKEYMPDKYDGETMYVVSALVDLGDCVPSVYANAKKLGLRTQKFPLERFLRWGVGTKTLPLNICYMILLTWLNTGSWEEALRHVPTRKLIQLHDVDQSDKVSRAARKGEFTPLAQFY